jgi:cysteine synthase A
MSAAGPLEAARPQTRRAGHTELRQLTSLPDAAGAKVFAKCEFQNPTGSHKDRVFEHMIEVLETRGEIRPGMTLIDCSTGNGGAALSAVGRARGYDVIVVMPAGMTRERTAQIRSFGGKIVETSPEGFLDESEAWASNYVREHPNAYFLDQSSNELNRSAWRQCGREIVSFFDERNATVDVFVCSIGTGGTFSGIAEILKDRYPALRTVAIEVDRSASLLAKRTGQPFVHRPHNLMGLGPGKIARNVREDLIDEIRTVSGDNGWDTMKRLVDIEGLPAGPTSGSNVFISLDVARELPPDATIVTVLFDSAWKYYSIWDGRYGTYGDT